MEHNLLLITEKRVIRDDVEEVAEKIELFGWEGFTKDTPTPYQLAKERIQTFQCPKKRSDLMHWKGTCAKVIQIILFILQISTQKYTYLKIK